MKKAITEKGFLFKGINELEHINCKSFINYFSTLKIAFDLDKYTIERGLKTVDLYGFIDFCCNNQRYIIRLDNLGI